MKSLRNYAKQARAKAGVTLVEVIISAALLSLTMAGLAGVATTCRTYIRSGQETSAASYAMEQAFDDIYKAGWNNVTDAESLRTSLANMDSRRLDELKNSQVKVTVSPYPPVVPEPTPLVVERVSNGNTTTLSQPSGFSLRSMLAVRVDVRVSWNSANNSQPRYREVSTVIAVSGLLK